MKRNFQYCFSSNPLSPSQVSEYLTSGEIERVPGMNHFRPYVLSCDYCAFDFDAIIDLADLEVTIQSIADNLNIRVSWFHIFYVSKWYLLTSSLIFFTVIDRNGRQKTFMPTRDQHHRAPMTLKSSFLRLLWAWPKNCMSSTNWCVATYFVGKRGT